MTTTPPKTKEEAIADTINKLIDEVLDHHHNTDCQDIECVLTGEPAKSFLQEMWDSATEEEQRKSIESDKRLKGIIESMKKEIEYLRSSQPARGKPVIRIKQNDNWYVPKITKAIDDPEGLYIEAEL